MDGEEGEIRNVDRARKCVVCVICCPFNCAFECVEEIRDTIIYCALCPQRCIEERKRKKKKREKSGLTRKEEYKQKCIKCCTPADDCCGRTPVHRCVCCFISPLNWCKLLLFFAIFYSFIFLFWIALMLIYLSIGSYSPFNS